MKAQDTVSLFSKSWNWVDLQSKRFIIKKNQVGIATNLILFYYSESFN